MKNRMISYGYGMRNGNICVLEQEAEILRQIFHDYISGKTPKEIAESLTESGVEFYAGNSQWNKNRVYRILEDRKYIGDCDGYPAIISLGNFEAVESLRNENGGKQSKPSEEIEMLRKTVYCAQCGKPYYRRAIWRSREKWFCTSKCKTDKYIDDAVVLGGLMQIVQRINDDPALIYVGVDEVMYSKTPEIMRYSNEIGRIMNSAVNFNVGKKLILTCAAKKFEACKENKGRVYTETVLRRTRQVEENAFIDSDYMENIIERIEIEKTGNITVTFINGAIVK